MKYKTINVYPCYLYGILISNKKSDKIISTVQKIIQYESVNLDIFEDIEGNLFIGSEWCSMKNNETPYTFKKRTKNEIRKFLSHYIRVRGDAMIRTYKIITKTSY